MRFKSRKILYIYTEKRSFVIKDLQILKSANEVSEYRFKTTNKKWIPFQFLKQFFFFLFFGWKYDVFISFFAGYHSILPGYFARWTNKKSFLFLGGTDCFKFPSFRYGNFTKGLYGKATCLSARAATHLVPVSSNLILSESKYYTIDSTLQGIYHWCAGLKTPYTVIPLEYDPTLFHRTTAHRKENSFISVAFGIEGTAFVRKGIDKIVMLANHLRDFQFTIIGCERENFPSEVPDNMRILGPVPYDQLVQHYNEHQFYLQLSIAEGFPSAICEAMLCECIPIGSNVAALPEIIAQNGFLVYYRDDRLIIDAILTATTYKDKDLLGRQAREHIMKQYGPGARKILLEKLLNP